MNRLSINNRMTIAGLVAMALGGLANTPFGRELSRGTYYAPERSYRTPEENTRRIAAAQAKRDRRCKRNLMLLERDRSARP